MGETTTTDISLNYMTSGYMSYEETIKHECSKLPYGLMGFAVVCMVISLCGLVGNGTVMWFLGFHLKRNPFSVYILNLAVADFSLLLMFFLVTLALVMLTANCPHALKVIYFYMDFLFAVDYLSHFFDLSSLGLLTAISMERCISVLFPIWYRCRRPKRLSGIVSGVLWALAGLFVSSMCLTFNFDRSYEPVFAGVAIAISMILSSMMLISNLSLFIKLRCSSQRRYPGKLYVVILLTIIFFFVLGIPFSVEVFVNLPHSHELYPQNVSFLLALLNCSINPVIYFLVGSCRRCRIQGSMKAALRRVFEEKATSKEESHVPEDTVVETTV